MTMDFKPNHLVKELPVNLRKGLYVDGYDVVITDSILNPKAKPFVEDVVDLVRKALAESAKLPKDVQSLFSQFLEKSIPFPKTLKFLIPTIKFYIDCPDKSYDPNDEAFKIKSLIMKAQGIRAPKDAEHAIAETNIIHQAAGWSSALALSGTPGFRNMYEESFHFCDPSGITHPDFVMPNVPEDTLVKYDAGTSLYFELCDRIVKKSR